MPKRVFGIEAAILQHNVLRILKGILPRKLRAAQRQIGGQQKGIFAFDRAAFEQKSAALPPEFGRNDLRIAYLHVMAFAHCFDAVQLALFDRNVMRIPQRGAAVFRQFGAEKPHVIVVPKRITQIEKTIL